MADAPVLGAGSPECGFKSHLPHHMKSGCNLNRSVRNTTVLSYTIPLFMGFPCHDNRVINRTVFRQKCEKCLIKNKIMRDLN